MKAPRDLTDTARAIGEGFMMYSVEWWQVQRRERAHRGTKEGWHDCHGFARSDEIEAFDLVDELAAADPLCDYRVVRLVLGRA